jgi:four helix bundle protein
MGDRRSNIGETNMMKFEDLEAWQTARTLTKQVYDLTRTPELARDLGVTGQIQQASVSIMSNVAEGFERGHLQEKLQFYTVARGSTAEVRSLTYVIEDNFSACAATAKSLRDRAAQTGRLVTGLIQSTERRRPGKILGHLLSSISPLLW